MEEKMKCWRFDGFEKLKIEVKRMDTKQSPFQPSALSLIFFFFWGGGGGGVNCLVVFPTHFNPFNNIIFISF